MILRPYQEKGVEHLLSRPFGRPHALLADSPGTGKTVMAIEAAKQANCKHGIILVPAIIKEQWARQMVTWGLCQPDEIQTVYGLDAEIDNRPWVIVNYDIIRDKHVKIAEGVFKKERNRNHKKLFERNWHTLIMDEAHRLKNHDASQTHAVLHQTKGLALKCYWKWPLSGSIVPNRPMELYALLRALAPEVIHPYDTLEKFWERYCGGQYLAGRGASHIEELTERLQPFMLRRELRDVWGDCPDILENVTWLDVPYQDHPEWLGSDFMFEGTERRVVAEAKIPYIVAYLKERLDAGINKIVCFTYHTKVIEQCAAQLTKYNPLKIYGGVTSKKREEYLARFQSDPDSRVFLLQIASGGEGVDGLQHVASELVEAEPEWSPGREDQAIDRLRRLGQKYPVILTKLYAKNSYEETIYWSNQRKRDVIDVILKPNGGTFIMSVDSRLESIDKSNQEIVGLLKQLVAASGAAPVAQQPTQNFAPPAAPALPVPTPPAAPSVPPVASAPPAPITPPPPAPVAGDPERDAFSKQVVALLSPYGETQGSAMVSALNTAFKVEKLALVPKEHFQLYLQHVQHAIATAGPPVPQAA